MALSRQKSTETRPPDIPRKPQSRAQEGRRERSLRRRQRDPRLPPVLLGRVARPRLASGSVGVPKVWRADGARPYDARRRTSRVLEVYQQAGLPASSTASSNRRPWPSRVPRGSFHRAGLLSIYRRYEPGSPGLGRLATLFSRSGFPSQPLLVPTRWAPISFPKCIFVQIRLLS